MTGMRKFILLFTAVSLFWLCGCMISASDPAAERAFEVYHQLHTLLPDAPLDMKDVLERAAAVDRTAVRIAWAELYFLKDLRTVQAVAKREKARITLNTLLGFLPSDPVVYDLETSPALPVELPHASAVEKAALIIDDGKIPPLELLRLARLAHVEAVTAMNEAEMENSPEKRLAYAVACIRLADVIGVAPEKLDEVEVFEERFNSANVRWEKSH